MAAKNASTLIARGSWLVRLFCSMSQAAETTSADVGGRSGEQSLPLYRRLSAIGATGESVTKTLDDFFKDTKGIRKDKLGRCVKELRRFHRFSDALEIMEWMEKKEVKHDVGDYAVRLDLVGKARGIEAAENYFDGLPEPAKNGKTYGSLLSCYCKEAMADKALAVFEKMDKMHCLSRSLPFNNIMALYLRLDQPNKVPVIVEDMKRRKVLPCTYSYNILMQSYGAMNDLEGVEGVVKEMERGADNLCDWTTYSNLATIYVKAGFFEKAELALKKFERKVDAGKRDAFHYLISLYARTSNLGEVNRVWDRLKWSFKVTTNVSYLFMLQALAILKDLKGIKKIFEEWEASCIHYDIKLPNVVIKAYLEQNMYDEAALVFDYALKRSNGPYFKARELFAGYYLRTHQLDLALEELKAVFLEVNDQWEPKLETLNAFFGYFEKEKDVDGAERVCKILKHIDRIDSNVYKLLLKTYIAAGRSDPEMRQRLEEDSIEVNSELEDLLDKVCPKQMCPFLGSSRT